MGTVDVERYTGPCLITTAVRPKPKSRPSANDSTPNDTSLDKQHGPAATTHHHQHQHPLPINDPRNWAGAPLLSMSATIRKSKPGAMNKNWHPPPVYLPVAPMMHPAAPMDAFASHTSHLQGAPLIRVPRHQTMPFHKKNLSLSSAHVPSVASRRHHHLHQQQQQQHHYVSPSLTPIVVCTPPSSLVHSIPSGPEMTSGGGNGGGEIGDGGSSSSGCPSSSDTCSVTSDEGLASGGSESSLPRIIKPRRRRKKISQDSHRTSKNGIVVEPTSCEKSSSSSSSSSSSAFSELDDLLCNQGDPLAELFRHSLSHSGSAGGSSGATETQPSCPTPPLWPTKSAGDDDNIWSSGCWHSPSPVWSPAGGSSDGQSPTSSNASHWPDQRVIRRPVRLFKPSSSAADMEPPTKTTYPALPEHFGSAMDSPLQHESSQYLNISSQLIASPFNGHRDIEIRFFSSAAQNGDTTDHNSPSLP